MTTARYAVDYDDALLDCRYPSHHWSRTDVRYVTIDRRKHVVVEFTCRCDAVRTDVLTLDGGRVKSAISYPADYLVKGQGRTDRSVWRRESVRRVLNGDT